MRWELTQIIELTAFAITWLVALPILLPIALVHDVVVWWRKR